MNSNLFVLIGLQFLAVIVIIAEFILPSGGILTVAAAALFGYTLYSVFSQFSAQTGFMFLIADLIAIPAAVIAGIVFLARSPAALKNTLSTTGGYTSQDVSHKKYIGKQGKVLTDLRPSGKALIEGKRLNVTSENNYISKGSTVTVIKTDGNRIVVIKNENSE